VGDFSGAGKFPNGCSASPRYPRGWHGRVKKRFWRFSNPSKGCLATDFSAVFFPSCEPLCKPAFKCRMSSIPQAEELLRCSAGDRGLTGILEALPAPDVSTKSPLLRLLGQPGSEAPFRSHSFFQISPIRFFSVGNPPLKESSLFSLSSFLRDLFIFVFKRLFFPPRGLGAAKAIYGGYLAFIAAFGTVDHLLSSSDQLLFCQQRLLSHPSLRFRLRRFDCSPSMIAVTSAFSPL